jgi:hypothetical protein
LNQLINQHAPHYWAATRHTFRPPFTGVKEHRFTDTKLGKWQPWNPTIEIVLKPILNPIPMYRTTVTNHIPRPSHKFGFDLLVEDWIAPQGRGQVADVFLSDWLLEKQSQLRFNINHFFSK